MFWAKLTRGVIGVAVVMALVIAVSQVTGVSAFGQGETASCAVRQNGTPRAEAGTPESDGTPVAGGGETRVSIGEDEALVWGGGTAGAVLAHGAVYDAASWRAQGDAIAEAGGVALAVENTSAAAILDGVRFLRETCGVETVTLIGASAGASGTFEAARREPAAIDGLIILSASGDVLDLGEFPKLFVASEGEGVAEAARRMAEEAPGTANEALVLPGTAHAQAIFETTEGSRLLEAILARVVGAESAG